MIKRLPWLLLLLAPLALLRSDQQLLSGTGPESVSRSFPGDDSMTCSTSSPNPPSGIAPDQEPGAFRAVSAVSFTPVEGAAEASASGPASSGRSSAAGTTAPGPIERAPTVDFQPSLGWIASTDAAGFRVTIDPSAPASPPFVGEAHYPVGFGDGRSPVWVEREIVGHRDSRLYVCLWVKLSRNWQGHDSGVNKIGFVWAGGKPMVTLAAVGADDQALVPQIRLQGLPSTVRSARNLEPLLERARIRRDVWHRWEVVLAMNDWTEANGEAHWWIDGRKVGEYRDIRFAGPTDARIWERVAWRPTWGGRGDVVREPMYMWLDHLYVSGAP